jgi:hypothetical protein
VIQRVTSDESLVASAQELHRKRRRAVTGLGAPIATYGTLGKKQTSTTMDPDINRQLRLMFDAHDEAFRALRAANLSMGQAIQAHDEAIQAALAANRAALGLLQQLSGNGEQS